MTETPFKVLQTKGEMLQRSWISHRKVVAFGNITNQRLSVSRPLVSPSHFSEDLTSFLSLAVECFLLVVADGAANSSWILQLLERNRPWLLPNFKFKNPGEKVINWWVRGTFIDQWPKVGAGSCENTNHVDGVSQGHPEGKNGMLDRQNHSIDFMTPRHRAGRWAWEQGPQADCLGWAPNSTTR